MSSKRGRTRAKILESGLRLMVERGFHGVGMEEVARNAGVSRQAIYLHFKSKADLLVAMVQYGDEKVGVPELLRPVREAKTAVEAMSRGVEAYGAIETHIYETAITAYAARRSDPAVNAAWQDRMTFRRTGIRQTIERLEAEGLLADGWKVDEAADFVWATLSVHTYEYLVVERGWTVDQLVRRMKTVVGCVLVDRD